MLKSGYDQAHYQLALVREDERRSVSREVHDQIIQELVGFNYQLGALRESLGPGAAPLLLQMQEQVRSLIGTARGLCRNLRGSYHDLASLSGAMRGWLDAQSAQLALPVALLVEGDDRLPIQDEVGLNLLRVMQEAVLNARKHAQARSVRVRLQASADEVLLQVQDDGVGFAAELLAAPADRQQFGLVGMRERMDAVAGRLEVYTSPGQGVRVVAWAPCVAHRR